MRPLRIRLRDNGPLVLEGPVTLVDADGNEFPLPSDKPVVALCRCGLSRKKPFCDGSHRDGRFIACDRAPDSSAPDSNAPDSNAPDSNAPGG